MTWEGSAIIQVPSENDLANMVGMPAGANEDQATRLANMSRIVHNFCGGDHVICQTDQVDFPPHWLNLFIEIKNGTIKTAKQAWSNIPEQDDIKKALLAVHSNDYLVELILAPIYTRRKRFFKVNPDILITPGTFEVLLRDLLLSLTLNTKVLISFGLPTHHAYKNKGRGFCPLNKIAIMAKALLVNNPDMEIIAVGTDINSDDGLRSILIHKDWPSSVKHIDLFDSRVYPREDFTSINAKFGKGKLVGTNKGFWQVGNKHYCAFDLAYGKRSKIGQVHPAIKFAVAQVEESLKSAKERHKKVALFLPSGWDSHKDESAACGKCILDKQGREQWLTVFGVENERFNDDDFNYFYKKLLNLVETYEANVQCIYWGLEGGYDTGMYTKQINNLLTILREKNWLQKGVDNAMEVEFDLI